MKFLVRHTLYQFRAGFKNPTQNWYYLILLSARLLGICSKKYIRHQHADERDLLQQKLLSFQNHVAAHLLSPTQARGLNILKFRQAAVSLNRLKHELSNMKRQL